VSEAFLDWHGGTVPAQTGEIVGEHALCLSGYHVGGTFEGVNSWSSSWNSNGRFVASERFAADATDIWALEVTP